MSGVPYGDNVAMDTNTTYSVGDGGLTQNNFTTTLKNKLDAIEDPDVSIGRISLSENNFTDTLKGKLDNIAPNANNYSLPATVSTNSKVYFSAQLADNSSSTAATTTHPNMGWLQSRTVDSTGNIGTSGTATEWNDFVTNGHKVPRTGMYQISAYQSIKAKSHNCGFTGLVMKVAGSVYARTREAELNPAATEAHDGGGANASLTNKPQRSESLIWVGSLTVNQRVTFEIDVDNGWENDDASMKGCYTIVNVD